MQPPLTIGTVLQNRYRLTKILSQGAVEYMYLAEDQGRFNEICTLKELNVPHASSLKSSQPRAEVPSVERTGVGNPPTRLAPEAAPAALQCELNLTPRDSEIEKLKQFQQEATSLCQLQHPQVPHQATFEQDQRLFLVQEYVEGKTYTTLLDERQSIGQTFTEAEVLQLFEQLLPVLEYLHGQGMIHRDISPDNIILRDRDHLPVLTNNGRIKELATQFLFPHNQPIAIGRLGYAPAEQIQTGRAYPSSDLYALAVTSVVLLTGQKPQKLFDDTQLVWNWQPWVTLSPELEQVLHRMLSYKPSDRYQSAAAVVQALQLPHKSTSSFQEVTASDSLSWEQSQMAPHPIAIESSTNQPALLESVISVSKNRKPWDNLWVMAILFLLVALVPGISAWLLVSSRLGPTRTPVPPPLSPQAFPSPLISGTTSPASPSPSDETSSGSNTTPTPSTEPVEPSQHLNLHAGKRMIVRGSLKAPIDYTFVGEQGQHLSATLTTEGVVLSILAPDQTLISDGANQSHYQGQLPATGTYTIKLQPAQGVVKSRYRLILHLANPG